MGHAIDYLIVKKRSDIMDAAENFAAINVDRGENPSGRYESRMTIHDDIICDSYEDAVQRIQSLDNGWYDDHAVRFRDNPKESAKMKDLQDRIKRTYDQERKYIADHSIHKRTSAFIGCPKCKSKLAADFFKSGEYCPVCGADLRPKSTLDKIKWYEDKIAELNKELRAEKNRNNKKSKNLLWCVKVEVHC